MDVIVDSWPTHIHTYSFFNNRFKGYFFSGKTVVNCDRPTHSTKIKIEIQGGGFSVFINIHPLANKKSCHLMDRIQILWYLQESNQGHTDFQSVALPTELRYLPHLGYYD